MIQYISHLSRVTLTYRVETQYIQLRLTNATKTLTHRGVPPSSDLPEGVLVTNRPRCSRHKVAQLQGCTGVQGPTGTRAADLAQTPAC